MNDEGLGSLAAEVSELVPEKSARVLQLEAERGNLLPSLLDMGYSRLYGTSASRGVYDLPRSTSVRYIFSTSNKTHLPAGFADCCILLGRPGRSETGDIAKLLAPGGLAIMEHDEGRGMDHAYGLEKVGTVAGKFDVFKGGLWQERKVGSVGLLGYSSSSGGISEYAGLVAERFRSAGVKVEAVPSAEEAAAEDVIVEYANGLRKGQKLPEDVRTLAAKGCRVVVEVHDTLERFTTDEMLRLQGDATLAYRANEAAARDGVRRYALVPHFSYANIPKLPPREGEGIVVGSFGFASKYKRYPLLVKAARKMGVPLRLLASINHEVAKSKTEAALEGIAREMGRKIDGPGSYSAGGVELEVGFFDPAKIAESMGGCSHILFAHTTSGFHHSGVMTMAKRFSRPVVALDSFQARQAQAVRVRSFFKGQALADSTKSFGANLLKRRLQARTFVGSVGRILAGGSLDRNLLLAHAGDLSRDDDGFDYMRAVLARPE